MSAEHFRSDMDRNSVREQVEQSSSPADKRSSLSAPILRVEKIRDELAAPVASEEESISPGEFSTSDHDRTSSHGDDRDNQLEPFIPPNQETIEKINAQVEFYFSNEHLLYDAFLLKHVKRNKQGFVSIKLITSFKRLKCITKDYRVVAHALQHSKKLELNPEKTKVRRLQPLPDHDETPTSRTVVVVNLPSENPSIESVAELFTDCGDIALIRIIRPTKPVPGDIKKYCGKHPEIGTVTCAVVEFDAHESAVKAASLHGGADNAVKVSLLSVKKPPNQPKPKAKGKKAKDDRRHSWKDDEVSDYSAATKSDSSITQVEISAPIEINAPASSPEVRRSRNSSPSAGRNSPSPVRLSPGERKVRDKVRKRVDNLGDELNDMDLSSSPSDRDMNWRLGPNRGVDRSKLSPACSPGNSPRVSPRASPKSSPNKMRRGFPKTSPLAGGSDSGLSPKASPSPLSSPEPSRRMQSSPAGGDASPGGSPWIQRRLKAMESPLSLSPRGSPLTGRRCPELDGVVRQPRGPDGTRGFSAGRGQKIQTGAA